MTDIKKDNTSGKSRRLRPAGYNKNGGAQNQHFSNAAVRAKIQNKYMGERGRRHTGMGKIGFDNERYLTLQSEQIRRRIAEFGG